MSERPALALVATDGRRVDLPLLPETLVRRRTADAPGERLHFVAHLDDRLMDAAGTTAQTLSALAALGDDVGELRWGTRRFSGTIAELTITETAFRDGLQAIGARIDVAFDVVPAEGGAVSVTVAGERWRLVPDLRSASSDDPVYELRVGDDGSLSVRFGDGNHGARPPPGDVHVRARYRVGGGPAAT